MNLELQRLARDNSRAILQIQEEQIQKILGQINDGISKIDAVSKDRNQLSSTIFDNAFGGNNPTKAGLEKYLK